MISILVFLICISKIYAKSNSSPQWFIIRDEIYLNFDVLEIRKVDVCIKGLKFKSFNSTHSLYEVYNENDCLTLEREKYIKGEYINNINDYIKEKAYYYIERYSNENCNSEPIEYALFTKEHCNIYFGVNSTNQVEILPEYIEEKNSRFEMYLLFSSQSGYNPNECTDEIKNGIHFSYENGKCQLIDSIDSAIYYINYDKFDNSIQPMALLLIFGLVMLFL